MAKGKRRASVHGIRKEGVATTRTMGSFDCGFRAFAVAPAAVVAAFIFGAGTIAGVILFVVAGIMLATAATGLCPTYTVLGISTHRADCIASATAFALVAPSPLGIVSPESARYRWSAWSIA